MRSHTLILFAPLAFAAKAPRTQHVISTSQSLFANILDTCSAGFEVCEDSCMPAGDTCCNDGTNESCLSGYYCIPDECCPKGQVCNSDGDDDDDNACNIDQAVCGEYCMPITGTCCDGQGYYCPEFGICTSGGLCCDLGDDCEGSGNSSGTTSTFKNLTTSSVSSHSSNNDSTFFPSGPTSTKKGNSSPTPKFTAKTTHNDDGLVFPTAVTSDNDSPSQPTQPTQLFTTVTVTASSTPPRPGQAGGRHPANSRIVAGFAAVAAFFIQRL